jgi:hypothetical protein
MPQTGSCSSAYFNVLQSLLDSTAASPIGYGADILVITAVNSGANGVRPDQIPRRKDMKSNLKSNTCRTASILRVKAIKEKEYLSAHLTRVNSVHGERHKFFRLNRIR